MTVTPYKTGSKAVKRKHIIIVASIVLSAFSLLGLFGLQVFLLQIAVEQKEEAFHRTVIAALASITARLESGEAVASVFTVDTTATGPRRNRTIVSVNVDGKLEGGKHSTTGPAPPFTVSGNRVFYSESTPKQVTVKVFDVLGREDTVIIDTLTHAGEHVASLDSAKYSRGQYFYSYSTDSTSMVMRVVNGLPGGVVTSVGSGERKLQLVQGIFDRLVLKEHQPLEGRLNTLLLDSAIAVGLKDAGIALPYAYGVSVGRRDSLKFLNKPEYRRELVTSPFRMRLFPGEMFAPSNELIVFFPNRAVFLLGEMAPLLSLTLLFVLIIVFFFVFAIRTIFRQKRFVGLMADFINNMTHEFKTPISTIQLASEAMMRPDVLGDRKKVLRYNGVIQDENARMRRQVEKILQMAVLEEGDYELNLVPLDLHDLVRKAVENIILQVEARQGTIECRLGAQRSVITGDPVHVTNIVHNLLDNANKYSHGAPRIEIITRNEGDRLIVQIKDAGIGMKEEDVKKVFDKYYRVSSGNLHDVKGFGLGLSYVKLMVTALQGTVGITSEYGKGTTVQMDFPLRPDR